MAKINTDHKRQTSKTWAKLFKMCKWRHSFFNSLINNNKLFVYVTCPCQLSHNSGSLCHKSNVNTE